MRHRGNVEAAAVILTAGIGNKSNVASCAQAITHLYSYELNASASPTGIDYLRNTSRRSDEIKMAHNNSLHDDLMIALVAQCPDGMHTKYYSLDEISKMLPARQHDKIEEAIHDEEAFGYVESLPVIGGPVRVRLTEKAYEDFDPAAKGWVPREDAVAIAQSMLEHQDQAASKIQIDVGLERRRFNPAFRHLLNYLEANDVGGFISKEIQPNYPAAAVVFTPKVKAVLRKFVAESASGETSPVVERPGLLSIALIKHRISERPHEVEVLSAKLAARIDRELENIDQNKPNEPAGLLAYEEYKTFLQELRDGLKVLESAVSIARNEASPKAKRQLFEKASETVQTLGRKIDDWIKTNSALAVDYSSKTVLLGLGTLLLTACGAPTYMAFPVLTYLLGGKHLHDAVKDAVGKDNKKHEK